MRINRIEITNFRQYQSLKLSFPKNGSHDLHIICADNGVGKTNILNAITWCLYDEEPHLGNVSTSLPRLNLDAKRKAASENKDKEEIIVTICAEDNDDKLQFERKQEWIISDNDVFDRKSEFTVVVATKGLDAIRKEGEEAIDYVEKYMPKKIKQYFYFDGEQLDSYFISDDSTKIKQTIHAISQVDVVTTVKGRLQTVIGQKNAEAGKKKPQIDSINKKISELTVTFNDVERQYEEIKKQINDSRRIIQENSEYLSGQENLPELESEYQELLKRKESLANKKQDFEKRLFAFIREMKVCLTFYPAAKETLNIIDEKRASNALPPDIDKKLLQKILVTHKCSICGHDLSEEETQSIRNMLEKIKVSSNTSNLLMLIRNELERIVRKAENDYCKIKENLINEQREIEKNAKDCEEKLQETDEQIRKFSNKHQIILWHNERKAHQDLLNTNLLKLGGFENQLKELKKQISLEEEKLTKEFAKEKQLEKLKLERDFLLKSAQIVESIETEMMGEVKEKMQERTKKYFLDLIWKKNVYTQIKLDEKYQLDLIHKDGYSCVGSCSAAERSLLALAFTLALHEVSGFSALLFIDTPVARVTSQNRENFANVLNEVSKNKQLIMTFTPDEYSENVRKVFEPIAATSVHLTMNSDNEITYLK